MKLTEKEWLALYQNKTRDNFNLYRDFFTGLRMPPSQPHPETAARLDQWQVSASGSSARNTNPTVYCSHEDFILQNGCVFNAPSNAEHYLGDLSKQCFYNSFRRLNESPDKKYFYVEGFLRYGHFPPIQHAWLVDGAGQVWETTSSFPPAERLLESSLYYGVPFPRETVIKLLTANGYESILHDFELDLFRKEFDIRQNLRNCFV